MDRRVTLKQHLWDQSFDGEKAGSALRILGVQSNTFRQKDLSIEAVIELSVPEEPPFRAEPLRITKTVPGDQLEAFQDSARDIVQAVRLRNESPWGAPRKYTEFSSPFVEDIIVGNFKPTDQPSSYFLDIMANGESHRFIVGDQDRLEEIRYIFRELNSFHQAICQQRATQVA